MNKEDSSLDNQYSSVFQAVCYTRDELPLDHLPFGLLSDSKKYLTSVDKNVDLKQWTEEVYRDSLKYILNLKDSETETEWHQDFIVFTNLQIAFYNESNLFENLDEFEAITDYTCKHIRNLRSYVARNAHLFVECLIHRLQDEEMFKSFSLKVTPQLFLCSGSEKSMYRDTARKNLLLLASRSSKIFDQDILWIFLENACNMNKKISTCAGECTDNFFSNINKEELGALDIPNFTHYLDLGLNGNNVEVKKTLKKIVSELPNLLPKSKFDSFMEELAKRPVLFRSIKKDCVTIFKTKSA